MTKKGNTYDEGYHLRKYAAELLGTMALVFFGCGAAVLAGARIGYLGIAFAFGMVVLAMVYAIGSISGCHINPAITVAMLAARKISLRDALVYIVVQCIGAIIGAELLLWIALGMPGYDLAANGLGQNGYGSLSPGKFSMQAGFIAETALTFFFLLAIFGATSKDAPKGFAGVGIGFTLFIVHLVGIPVTGTSVNPARSLGPALLVGGETLNQLWLFWVAPLIGGLLAALVWVLVLAPPEPRFRGDMKWEWSGDKAADREKARKVRLKKGDAGTTRPRSDAEEETEDEDEEDAEGEGEKEEDEEDGEEEDEEGEAAEEEGEKEEDGEEEDEEDK